MKSLKINTILNVIKQLCSVLFPLVTVPYITRILQATHYGEINFTASIISYFSIFATFGVSSYAVREGARIRKNKERFQLFANEIYTINCITAIISYISLLCLILLSAKIREYSLLIIVQSVSIFLSAVGADWINTIYEDYYYITIRYIVIQIISLIMLFVFVHNPDDYIIYTIIHVFATAGGNLFNIKYIKRYVHLNFCLNKKIMRHLKPMALLLCKDITFTIYVNSDITILGLLCSATDVGIYSLVVKIYTLTKTMINSIILVSSPRMSLYLGENKQEKYLELCKKVFTSTITILLPVIIGVISLSKYIIIAISGYEYISGSLALQLLGITLLFAVLVAFYISCVLIPHRMDKQCLFAAFVSAGLNVVLNFILIPFWGYNAAALTTLLSELTTALIYKNHSKTYLKNEISPHDRKVVIIGCIFVWFTCIAMKLCVENIFLCLAMSMILSCIVYFSIQIVLKNSFIIEITGSLKDRYITKLK